MLQRRFCSCFSNFGNFSSFLWNAKDFKVKNQFLWTPFKIWKKNLSFEKNGRNLVSEKIWDYIKQYSSSGTQILQKIENSTLVKKQNLKEEEKKKKN